MRRLLAALALGIAMPAHAMPAHAAEITASATYLARIATPPGAVLDARLVGTAKPGEAPDTLAFVRRTEAGNPPWPLALPHEGAREGLTLAVTLRHPDGTAFFAGAAPVGEGATEVVLRPAGQPAATPLVGTRWRLFAMGEGVAAPLDGERDIPWIRLDAEGRVTGSSGCNVMGAGWTGGEGAALSFSQGFGTMMACEPAVMEREQAVFAMLAAVSAHAVEGDRLTLVANGAPLAVFVAEPAPQPPN